MVKLNTVYEMIAQRRFKVVSDNVVDGSDADDIPPKGDILARSVDEAKSYMYVKLLGGKFELGTIREFIWSTFDILPEAVGLRLKGTRKNVIQMVIISKSFQKTHLSEFKEVSSCIQLIREDFFNINVTKKAPVHEKVSNWEFKKRDLPIIKLEDPICIFHNFTKGDVIRVVRSDGDIAYRIVR
jgi:DNA-directed RNA polymerase subunit H (RpoH/RPB5)